MNHLRFNAAGLACVLGMLPVIVEAQTFEQCGPPMNCVITRPRPVVTTQYHQQQVSTVCNVTETQMTARQVVENVPVTTCKNVTVDEGGYQMVWVPKPVTRQVAQTVIQQQVKTVNVPVQVTRQIPQISTQMVPVQSVQYVNETVPLRATAMASTCSTCGGGQAMAAPLFAPQPMFSSVQFAPAPIAPVQFAPAPIATSAIPTMPAIEVPTYQNTSVSSPIRPAPAFVEETVRARGVPTPQDEAIRKPQRTSKFVGVPSAASVWQRQGSYAR